MRAQPTIPIALTSLIACLSGCAPITNESKISGVYALAVRGVKIELRVAKDHTYVEKVTFSDGAQQTKSGEWKWQEEQLCFGALLVPSSAFPAAFSYGIQSRIVGRCYQMDRCAAPVWEYGKTILEINPDTAENFVRIGSTEGE